MCVCVVVFVYVLISHQRNCFERICVYTAAVMMELSVCNIDRVCVEASFCGIAVAARSSQGDP